MATAEQLLNEAHYAFNSISYGESRENRRNAARATSLCRKIIRRFPTGIEADEAHAILRRLGEEAYTSTLARQHKHTTQAEHHRAPSPLPRPMQVTAATSDVETFNWSALIAAIFAMPKTVFALVFVAGILLFGLLGPLLFLPLIAFIFLAGPFRNRLKPEQRRQLNEFVVRANAYLENRRG